MASEEHKNLANVIKNVHENLRKSAQKLGASFAWEKHLNDENQLTNYSKAMKDLAVIWEENARKEACSAESRIQWVINYCTEYFCKENILLEKRLKEKHIAEVSGINTDFNINFLNIQNKIKLLDVGSCFNPFGKEDIFDVTAIDLSPANKEVLKCDFLHVNLGSNLQISYNELKQLPKLYFDCITFSLLLEYLPSSEQRLECCKRAYDLLNFEGILIIITPDSQHVGKNAKLMKNWRYTLGHLGFSRIKFEKLSHITCLVFRKSLSEKISQRWSDIHKESYMTISLEIPQDL